MTRHDTEAAANTGQRPSAQSVTLPIDTLVAHPRNARRGDIELLAESLQAHGQYAPLVAQASTLHVLRGNHLLAAAKLLGWTELNVQLIDVDDDQALRILLIDNRASDKASYDAHELVDLLASLPTLESSGYCDADLARLLEELQHVDPGHTGDDDDGRDLEDDDHDDDDEDDRDRVRRRSDVNVGDVFALGAHRILCGDPRDPFAWERLLEGERLRLVIIHSPVGAELAEPADHLTDSFAAADPNLAPGARVLLVRHAGTPGLDELAALAGRWQYQQEIVHLHTPIEIGMAFPVAHGTLALAQKPPLTTTANPAGRTSVWTTDRPAAAAVDALSDAGTAVGVVYSTSADALIASEEGGRTAHLLQPNPRILTAIVDAWQEAGGAAIRRL
jgi:hypothetical protein